MLPPLKPGATLARFNDPVIETEHLTLRPWRAEDVAPNTASQAVARRLGAGKDGVTDLFGHVADIWVTTRASWAASRN
jgi:RimJ/RimL family protein N-acetyltransferase